MCFLVLLEGSWWAGFNRINLVRISIQNVGRDWLLSDFCHWKFKEIPKNQVLEGKISWGRGNTWANAQATLVNIKRCWFLYIFRSSSFFSSTVPSLHALISLIDHLPLSYDCGRSIVDLHEKLVLFYLHHLMYPMLGGALFFKAKALMGSDIRTFDCRWFFKKINKWVLIACVRYKKGFYCMQLSKIPFINKFLETFKNDKLIFFLFLSQLFVITPTFVRARSASQQCWVVVHAGRSLHWHAPKY
jgi:hypothetical protein